jgi:small subunit ribosomal protein S20
LPNTKSAAKAARQAERRRQRNRPIRTAARTYVRKARLAIADGEATEAAEAVVAAQAYLDSAATKGVIHKNNAARRKSRLMKQLNKLQGGAASA